MSGDIRLSYLYQRCSQMPTGTSFSLLDASVSLSLCLSQTCTHNHMHSYIHSMYSPLCTCILIYLPPSAICIFLDQSEWEDCRREGPVPPLQPIFPIKQLYDETIQLKLICTRNTKEGFQCMWRNESLDLTVFVVFSVKHGVFCMVLSQTIRVDHETISTLSHPNRNPFGFNL